MAQNIQRIIQICSLIITGRVGWWKWTGQKNTGYYLAIKMYLNYNDRKTHPKCEVLKAVLQRNKIPSFSSKLSLFEKEGIIIKGITIKSIIM